MSRDFSGSEANFFSVADNASLSITGTAMTIAAWVRLDAIGNDTIIGKRDDAAASLGYQLSLQAGAFVFAIGNGSGSFDHLTGTGDPLTTGVWQHVVGRKNGTGANALQLFINGALDSGLTSNLSIGDTTAPFRIGTDGSSFWTGVDGLIAECAVWAAALTDAEIQSIAKGISPLLVRNATLRGYWPLYGSGSEKDYSGNGNHLTLNGTIPAGTRNPPVASLILGHGQIDSPLHTEIYTDSGTVYLDLSTSATEEVSVTDTAEIYLNLSVVGVEGVLRRFDETFDDLSNWDIEPGNEDAVPLHYYISRLHATDGDTSLHMNNTSHYAGYGDAWFLKWMDTDGGGLEGVDYWLTYSFYIPSWAELYNDNRSNKGWILPAITAYDDWSQNHIGPSVDATSTTAGRIRFGTAFSASVTSTVLAEKTWHTVRFRIRRIDANSYQGEAYVNNVLVAGPYTNSAYAGSALPPLGIIMGHDTSNTKGQVFIDDMSWYPGTDPGEPSTTETGDQTSTEQWVQITERLNTGTAYVGMELPSTPTEVWLYWEVYIPQNLLDGFVLNSSGEATANLLIAGGAAQSFRLQIRNTAGVRHWYNPHLGTNLGTVVGDQWYRIEWHYNSGVSQSSAEIRINGTQQTITAQSGSTVIEYMNAHDPWAWASTANFDGTSYVGIDSMGYSTEGWISEGSSFDDYWDFEGDDALNVAEANYPTPPWYADFGTNGASTALVEGGVGPGPGIPDAIVYLTMTPVGVEVVPTIDQATVPLRLTPIFATAVDVATVPLVFTVLGGECFDTWSSDMLGSGEASVEWFGRAIAEWSAVATPEWSYGDPTPEGVHC